MTTGVDEQGAGDGPAAGVRTGTHVTGSEPLAPATVRGLEAAGLDVSDVVRVVRAALDEDFRYGPDVTSNATVAGRTVTADMVARESGVVAGLPVVLAVFDLLSDYLGADASGARAVEASVDAARADGARAPEASTKEAHAGTSGIMGDTFGPHRGHLYPMSSADGRRAAGPVASATALVADGTRVVPGDAVLRVSGDAVAVLGAERTMLNFVTHLSGIASLTREWADALAGTGAVVRDTRKTLPGLRSLEKYAARCGGGENHRMALGDAALVKDNHVAAAGGVTAAVRAVRAAAQSTPDGGELVIEVECDSVAQVREALAAGARFILLDNMPVPTLREAVAVARAYDGVRLEASGGLRLANAHEVATTGVDYLSVGALTHSSRALDLGLDYSGTA